LQDTLGLGPAPAGTASGTAKLQPIAIPATSAPARTETFMAFLPLRVE
jgi:hypothetical protein